MPQGLENRLVVINDGGLTPNNPQPTVFMHVEHPMDGPDEMCIPHAIVHAVDRGEESVLGFRTPY